MSQHLKAFLESFIANRYRKQWLDAFERAKSDYDILRGMDNVSREFDERFCTELPKGNKQQDIAFIKKAIAPYKLATCQIFSAQEGFSQQAILVEEALSKVVGSSSTTLISFLPGKIVYFEGHSVGERYLCIKSA